MFCLINYVKIVEISSGNTTSKKIIFKDNMTEAKGKWHRGFHLHSCVGGVDFVQFRNDLGELGQIT